jgi:GDP-mannose pyrophosphatase NudK
LPGLIVQGLGDKAFIRIFHPLSEQFLEKCDATLRVGGDSAGADRMVEIAQQKRPPNLHKT